MIALIVALLTLLGPSPSSERLRALPDVRLSSGDAVEHLWAARVAGVLEGVDPSTLLAIAWHESRFQSNNVSWETSGRHSCGAMTPEPVARCARVALVYQYLAGATHLRGWQRALGARALIGYAGGFALAARCRRDDPPRACGFARQIARLASRIGAP